MLSLKLDVERDPYDLELNMYPDNNSELKKELQKLVPPERPQTKRRYSLVDKNSGVIKI